MSNAIEKPTLDDISSAEQLIRKGSFLDRLLSKERLNWYDRVLLREAAYDLFAKLTAWDDLRGLREYGECFANGSYPNTLGWRIFKEAFKNYRNKCMRFDVATHHKYYLTEDDEREIQRIFELQIT